MVVVIQCAATKQPGAGHLRTRSGQRVVFVGRPDLAPGGREVLWARPDDVSDVAGLTWRAQLETMNSDAVGGTKLLRAVELYQPAAFRRLAGKFGLPSLFILSAGWGLVRADYRLPQYDITFSKQAEPYKRRHYKDRYEDFNQLAPVKAGPVVFLGGKDYLPLFFALTSSLEVPVVVPFRSEPADRTQRATQEGRVRFVPYRTTAKTNWHYACAEQLCCDPTFLERAE